MGLSVFTDLAQSKIVSDSSLPVNRRFPIPGPSGHRFFTDCLRENWARWVEWQLRGSPQSGWFVSMTFKTFIELNRAERLKKIWLARLTEALRRSSNGSSRLRWFSAIEWQIREVVHFHLLVVAENIDSLSRKRWESRWQTMGVITGICRIYNADFKAAPYLAKYTTKSLGGDIQWGGYWRGMITPASLTCGCSRGVFSVESNASQTTG